MLEAWKKLSLQCHYMAHWHNNVLCILLIQDKHTSDSPLNNSQLCATVLSWVSLPYTLSLTFEYLIVYIHFSAIAIAWQIGQMLWFIGHFIIRLKLKQEQRQNSGPRAYAENNNLSKYAYKEIKFSTWPTSTGGWDISKEHNYQFNNMATKII